VVAETRREPRERLLTVARTPIHDRFPRPPTYGPRLLPRRSSRGITKTCRTRDERRNAGILGARMRAESRGSRRIRGVGTFDTARMNRWRSREVADRCAEIRAPWLSRFHRCRIQSRTRAVLKSAISFHKEAGALLCGKRRASEPTS